MVAVITQLAKERKGPAIRYQVLFYPVTDAAMDTESYSEFANGPWLTKPAMEWFWKLTLRTGRIAKTLPALHSRVEWSS